MSPRRLLDNSITLEELTTGVSETITQILRENIYETNLNRQDFARLENQKKMLRAALKVCATGDSNAKAFVKELVREIIVEKHKVNEKSINHIILFEEPGRMTYQDKFEIVLYLFSKEYKSKALKHLVTDNHLDNPQMYNGVERYIITRENIEELYARYSQPLTFMDKLDILTQRVYSRYKGLGIIDDIRDMEIDGVSGGVSGDEINGKSVWIFFAGKSINLEFLKFESERELERICNNIYNIPSVSG